MFWCDAPIPADWTLPAGTVVNNLSFRLIDKSGDALVFDPEWFKSKNTYATPSWVEVTAQHTKDKKKTQKPKNYDLPDLQMPPRYVPEAQEFELNVLIIGSPPLNYQFAINFEPPKPIGWKILTSDDITDGVMSGNSVDLLSKLRGIFSLMSMTK